MKRGLALGQSFPNVDVHSGELPPSRKSPGLDDYLVGICGEGRQWVLS